MNTHRKDKTGRIHPPFRRFLQVGMFIAAAMILFFSVAAWLIDTQSVKKMIVKEIRQKAGVPMTVQEVRLSVLPRPHVTLAGGNVSIPGRTETNWGALSVYPRLLPLFVGHIQIGKVTVQRPDADITVPGKAEQPDDRRRAPLIATTIREAFAPMVASISAMGEEMEITIAGGRVSISMQDNTVIQVTDIEATIDASATLLDIDLQSAAEFCETIAVKGSIDPRSLKSQGQINLVQLRMHLLPASLLPAGAVRPGGAPVDLDLTFHMDGADGFRAQVRCTLPMVTVQRGKNQLEIKGRTLAGRVYQDGISTSVELSELSLDAPRLTLGGTFFKDRNSGKMKVEVSGRDVDIASIRHAALILAGDIAEVTDTFDIVKGGRLPAVRLATRGQSIDSLVTLENMVGRAGLLQGEILVPGVELTATDVSADLTLAEGMLAAENLTARDGNTRVNDGAMRLGLSGDNPPFHLDIGMTADLSRVPPILKQVVSDKRFLREMDRIHDIRGIARGRLVLGERLEAINTSVSVSDFNLSARTTAFPYSLEFTGSDFSCSEASVAVKDLTGHILPSDSSQEDPAVNWENGAQWLTSTFHLPRPLILRPPLAVANGRFSLEQDGRNEFSGELTVQDELKVSADVLLGPDRINIRKLTVKDKVSQATIGFTHLEKNNIVLDFGGNLERSTMEKLLADNQTVPGSIKGDLHVKVVNDHPLESAFEGEASANDLVLFRHSGLPVTVKHISVKGIKNAFHVESDMLVRQDHGLTLRGDLTHSPQGIRVDADLDSNGIELDKLADALGKGRKNDDGEKKQFWDLPVEGVVRLDAEFVKYGRFVWQPLAATITLNPEKITVASTQTVLCGVSTPGTVTLTPDAVSLKVRPVAHHQDINTSVTCLWDTSAKVLGSFDLSGEISGQGRPEDLLASISGDIEISSTGGTIYAGRTYRNIRDIFKLINITEIYRGRLLELSQDGFSYNTMKTNVRIKNNTIIFEEGIIDAPELNAAYSGILALNDMHLDITALVAPLKTVDTIVKKSPIIGYVAGGQFATIPISLKGDPNHPDIGILPPAAVGEGLVGILKRTLNLPVKIVDPLMPAKQ